MTENRGQSIEFGRRNAAFDELRRDKVGKEIEDRCGQNSDDRGQETGSKHERRQTMKGGLL